MKGTNIKNSDLSYIAVLKIISEQELIIGPVAWEEASHVEGLKVVQSKKEVFIFGPKKEVLEKLVLQYTRLFGRASKEVCKEAVKDIIDQIPKDQVPLILK